MKSAPISFPGGFLRLFARVDGLLFPFGSNLVALAFTRHERDFLGIGELSLQIRDEGLHADMFMTAVQDRPHDDDGLTLVRLFKIP